MNDDYYKILGVSKSSSEKELKKAYRKLAMKHHPDRNQNNSKSEAKFKKICEAYETLKDKKKRSMYDQMGHDNFTQNNHNNYNNFNENNASEFADIFSDIFGTRRKSNSEQKQGNDLQYNLKLNLEEALHGVEKTIKINTFISCKKCKGIGGENKIQCLNCNGIGSIKTTQGFFSFEQTCNICKGSGKKIKNLCIECEGRGRIKSNKNLNIKIPKGVDEGDRIRISGEGEVGENKYKSGDLYVRIQIKQHEIFKRKGNNLHCKIPVSFATVCLGGDIIIPTINGKISMKIPIETQTGKIFRIRGKGVKSIRNNTAGDLMCKIFIETPIDLNKNQKEKLKNFYNSLKNEKHWPKYQSWFKNVKIFFTRNKN